MYTLATILSYHTPCNFLLHSWSMKRFVVMSIYSMLHNYLFITIIPHIGMQSKVVPMHAMQAHGGIGIWLHLFLTSELNGGEWSAPRHNHFTPGYHVIGDWVGSRASRNALEKRKFSCPCQVSNPASPAHSLATIQTILFLFP